MNTLFDKIWDKHVVQIVEDALHSFTSTVSTVTK